jgi:glycosyltransferase involved in cell wall biosynthesis
MGRVLFSAIIPCYNEESNIDYFYREFCRNDSFFQQQGIDFELIYIDDGSTDKTSENVRCLREKDPRVQLISFSRNFGKEAAMYAGLQAARGDYVSIMDADLQDPPSLLPEMFGYLEQGYDQAATRRTTRKGEPPVRSWFARRFYHLINRFSKTEIVDGSRDFRLMKRCVVDAVLQVTEYNRFSKGIFSWVGFKTKWLEYENVERKHGETKWNFWSLFHYAIDGIVAYSTVPLTMAAFIGVLFCFIALVMIIFIIVRKLIFGDPTPGWPSLVCIILLVSGVQLLCTGVIGEYLSKAYLEVKKRPIYIVREDTIKSDPVDPESAGGRKNGKANEEESE